MQEHTVAAVVIQAIVANLPIEDTVFFTMVKELIDRVTKKKKRK